MKQPKIFIAGHRGLVGSAIERNLRGKGYEQLITRTRRELDLLDRGQVDEFFRTHRPDWVFLAAAKVGGIMANSTLPAEFIYENLVIETNVIDSAHRHDVSKLLFLGSSCIYPKHASQPMAEDALLTGLLEPTNEPYAIAKIAGIKMCHAYHQQYGREFLCVMPTNLYGPNDNFDLETSHVLPALMRKMHDAKVAGAAAVEVWGSGQPRREFLHCDDLADACTYLMESKTVADTGELVNIGVGKDLSIRELAELIAQVVGFTGELQFDPSKPDGTPRKLLNVDRLTRLGWTAKISLRGGLEQTYAWMLQANGEAAAGGTQS